MFQPVVIRIVVKLIVQPFVLLPRLGITMRLSVSEFPMKCTMLQVVVVPRVVEARVGAWVVPAKVIVIGPCLGGQRDDCPGNCNCQCDSSHDLLLVRECL